MSAATRAVLPNLSPPANRLDATAAPSDTAEAFPFDACPYGRLPPPLGGGRTELPIVRRRAIIAATVAWLPIAVLAAIEGLALRDDPRESFLLDLGAYGRYLVALPLLILADHVVLPRLGRIARHFVTSGLVPSSERPRFEELVASSRRLLTSRIAEIVIAAGAYLITIALSNFVYPPTISTWVAPYIDDVPTLSLAGWWRVLVSQPLYIVVLGMWVWRAGVWFRFLWKVTRLDLRLVASHPDHMGGLQFVALSVRAFPLVAFAMASGAAANLAELLLIDGRPVTEFLHLIALIVVAIVLLFAGPLIALNEPLKRLRSTGIFIYNELASEVAQRFEARWLRPDSPVTDAALGAADFSAMADLYSVVANVDAIKLIPIDIKAVAPLLGAALLPFFPLLLLAMPLAEMLKVAVHFLA